MKNFGILKISAIAISAFAMASCMNNELPSIEIDGNPETSKDNEELRVVIGTVTPSTEYSYQVEASTKVEWYIDGTKKTTGSTFEGSKAKNSEIKIKATAISDDYSKVTIEKTVKLDVNGKIIKLDIPRISKNPDKIGAIAARYEANAKGKIDVVNAVSNRSLAYAAATTATMALTIDAIGKVGNDKELYINVENAPTDKITQDLSAKEEFFDIMTIKCGAPGVALGADADITIENSNIEKGMIFKCSSNGNEVQATESGKVVVKTKEMNDLTLSCQVRVEFVDSATVNKDEGFFTVTVGNPAITYFTRSGFVCDYDKNEFITKYLTAKFGQYTENAKQTVKIANNDSKAHVPYSLEQKIYKYKLHFGDLIIDVSAYGPDKLTIEADKAEKFRGDK